MLNSELVFPQWRKLLDKSLNATHKQAESKFFQVASIALSQETNELSVENRTVVFRRFGAHDNTLLAITDRRTEKYTQWQQIPKSQICWYFTKTREQYRITNTVELLEHDCNSSELVTTSVRASMWKELSDKARAQFSWPSPKDMVDIKHDKIVTDSNNISENFVVIVLKPSAVDYLNLNTKPHTRELHRLHESSGKWTYKNVNP